MAGIISSDILGILVCFGIPIAGLVCGIKKNKAYFKSFIAGVATFVVMQIIIRIPILRYVLPGFAWYSVLEMNTVKYSLFLGVTAALAEEVGRWLFMKIFFKKRVDYDSGLIFGLGHGGIEAILLVGINLVVILVMVIEGKADTGSMAEISALGIFAGAIERGFAILFHVAASCIVMYGICIQKEVRYLIAAIVLHTLIDFIASFGSLNGWSIWIIEIIVAVTAVLSMIYALALWKENQYEK